VDETDVASKSSRLERWRHSAMKQKFSKNEYLKRLLRATGHALLVETTGISSFFIFNMFLVIKNIKKYFP
jgi:predicted NAD-dependent protein-ADP-ribosyltransferase YbiA (DUF1768 family)